MIIAGKYEVPDECPPNCPEDVGDVPSPVCLRCPVFNCKDFDYLEGETWIKMRLVEPEGFREDWAKVWSEWFKGGMRELPELFF